MGTMNPIGLVLVVLIVLENAETGWDVEDEKEKENDDEDETPVHGAATIRSGDEAVVVWLALLAQKPLIGFLRIVTGEFFLVRIPLQGLLHADGNHPQMGHGDGTVADFHVADRVVAAAH